MSRSSVSGERRSYLDMLVSSVLIARIWGEEELLRHVSFQCPDRAYLGRGGVWVFCLRTLKLDLQFSLLVLEESYKSVSKYQYFCRR